MKQVFLNFLIISMVFISCQSGNKSNVADRADSLEDSLSKAGEVLTDPLEEAKANYARISNIRDWDQVDSADIYESTEGGIAKYYFKHNTLERIDAYLYGEAGKYIDHLYLKDGKLSFVHEEYYLYNVPYYGEGFDEKKSELHEYRYYFQDGEFVKLIASKNVKDMEEAMKDRAKDLIDLYNKLLHIKANNYKAEMP